MIKKITGLIIGTAVIGTLTFGTVASAEEIEIQKGDTLWNIAQENSTTVNELKKVNNLTSNLLYPKQILKTTNNGKTENKETTHKVKLGDTLYKISSQYNVTVNNLKEWNNLNSDLIIVNQELSVKEGQKKVSTEKAETTKPVEKKSTKAVEEKPKEKEAAKPAEKAAPEKKSQSGQSMTMEATAYTAECYGCSGVTATGIDLNADRNKKVIAVDPSVIPLGSRVHVEGYGEAIAGDTGGAIKGNRIDLHVPTKGEAYDFGRRTVNITVLN